MWLIINKFGVVAFDMSLGSGSSGSCMQKYGSKEIQKSITGSEIPDCSSCASAVSVPLHTLLFKKRISAEFVGFRV